MSSEDNLFFSKITSNRSSEVVPRLAIDDEEGTDIQSIVASTGIISVFDLVSESALDDARSISMASIHSSMQGSLLRQSLRSSRQSLNLTIRSLNDGRARYQNDRDG